MSTILVLFILGAICGAGVYTFAWYCATYSPLGYTRRMMHARQCQRHQHGENCSND